MIRPIKGLIRILDNATVVTSPVVAGVPVNVEHFRNVCFQLFSSGSANFTVKFAISYSTIQPNFAAAASATNVWSYVQVKDLQNPGTGINGTTGIVYSGTDAVTSCEVNTDYIRWFCPIITAQSAGHIFIEMNAANDAN